MTGGADAVGLWLDSAKSVIVKEEQDVFVLNRGDDCFFHFIEKRFRVSFRREFPDERPRDFSDLAIVVMNEEPVMKLLPQLDTLDTGPLVNFVCFADGAVRFQEAESIGKIDFESVFPLEVSHVAERHAFGSAERDLKRIKRFQCDRFVEVLR